MQGIDRVIKPAERLGWLMYWESHKLQKFLEPVSLPVCNPKPEPVVHMACLLHGCVHQPTRSAGQAMLLFVCHPWNKLVVHVVRSLLTAPWARLSVTDDAVESIELLMAVSPL